MGDDQKQGFRHDSWHWFCCIFTASCFVDNIIKAG